MKIMLAMAAILLCQVLLGSRMAYGTDTPNKRQDCNQQAKGLSGIERNRIISACIRHNANVKNKPPTLGKITECNKKAGDMTGERRLTFVDKCMQTP